MISLCVTELTGLGAGTSTSEFGRAQLEAAEPYLDIFLQGWQTEYLEGHSETGSTVTCGTAPQASTALSPPSVTWTNTVPPVWVVVCTPLPSLFMSQDPFLPRVSSPRGETHEAPALLGLMLILGSVPSFKTTQDTKKMLIHCCVGGKR